jgi:hypothetical protein
VNVTRQHPPLLSRKKSETSAPFSSCSWPHA